MELKKTEERKDFMMIEKLDGKMGRLCRKCFAINIHYENYRICQDQEN
jgi:hypothetical protein